MSMRANRPSILSMTAELAVASRGAPVNSERPVDGSTLMATGGESAASAGAGKQLLLLDGGAITQLDVASRARVRSLPMGVFSPDGSTLYAATSDAKSTTVQAIAFKTGETVAQERLEGRSKFPAMDVDAVTTLGGIDPQVGRRYFPGVSGQDRQPGVDAQAQRAGDPARRRTPAADLGARKVER